MIIEKTFYSVACDSCGHQPENDDVTYWSEKWVSQEMAANEGFEEIDGKDYCENCYEVNDNDEYVVINKSNTPHP